MNRKVYIIILSALLLILLPGIALAVTPPTVLTIPSTDTSDVYNISNNITISGNISGYGGGTVILQGFVYDAEPRSMPEPGDNITETEYTHFVSEDGTFTVGEYSANITHLESGTNYFFRAVIYNQTYFGYGEELTFTTTAETESSANVTADEFADIASTLSTISATLFTYMNLFVIGLAVCGLVSLAFIRGSMILYVLSGIAVLVFGLYFTDTHTAIGVLIAILGLYCFWKAIGARV